jgi:hypothetical protein
MLWFIRNTPLHSTKSKPGIPDTISLTLIQLAELKPHQFDHKECPFFEAVYLACCCCWRDASYLLARNHSIIKVKKFT